MAQRTSISEHLVKTVERHEKMTLNIDTFDELIDAERKRVQRVITQELEAFQRPETIRREVERYARLSDEMRKRLPTAERTRLDKLLKKLESSYGR